MFKSSRFEEPDFCTVGNVQFVDVGNDEVSILPVDANNGSKQFRFVGKNQLQIRSKINALQIRFAAARKQEAFSFYTKCVLNFEEQQILGFVKRWTYNLSLDLLIADEDVNVCSKFGEFRFYVSKTKGFLQTWRLCS